ncbi:MAG: hypothetical protein ACXWDN_14580 [Limisphaerales bacterium]
MNTTDNLPLINEQQEPRASKARNSQSDPSAVALAKVEIRNSQAHPHRPVRPQRWSTNLPPLSLYTPATQTKHPSRRETEKILIEPNRKNLFSMAWNGFQWLLVAYSTQLTESITEH